MDDKLPIDDIRRQIQESLARSKREQLQDEFGMQFDHVDSELPPEMQNEWLDSILEFERKFETAKSITVRERIGNPSILPLHKIPIYALDEAIEKFLDLLAENGIRIDFLGDWDEQAVYTYLCTELLDEEIDDVQIEGWSTVFTPTTPAYDVEFWTETFISDIFLQERTYFLSGLEKQPLFDSQGNPVSAVDFQQKIKNIWQYLLPKTRCAIEMLSVQIEGEEGEVIAAISFNHNEEILRVESSFCLQPSPYTGWDVVQTTFLDDMLALLS